MIFNRLSVASRVEAPGNADGVWAARCSLPFVQTRPLGRF